MICLATCWDGHEEARGTATRDNAPDKLETLLTDPTPEVRAAAVMALGTFIQVGLTWTSILSASKIYDIQKQSVLNSCLQSCRTRREHENTLDQNIAMRLLQHNLEDGSPLVRR